MTCGGGVAGGVKDCHGLASQATLTIRKLDFIPHHEVWLVNF